MKNLRKAIDLINFNAATLDTLENCINTGSIVEARLETPENDRTSNIIRIYHIGDPIHGIRGGLFYNSEGAYITVPIRKKFLDREQQMLCNSLKVPYFMTFKIERPQEFFICDENRNSICLADSLYEHQLRAALEFKASLPEAVVTDLQNFNKFITAFWKKQLPGKKAPKAVKMIFSFDKKTVTVFVDKAETGLWIGKNGSTVKNLSEVLGYVLRVVPVSCLSKNPNVFLYSTQKTGRSSYRKGVLVIAENHYPIRLEKIGVTVITTDADSACSVIYSKGLERLFYADKWCSVEEALYSMLTGSINIAEKGVQL